MKKLHNYIFCRQLMCGFCCFCFIGNEFMFKSRITKILLSTLDRSLKLSLRLRKSQYLYFCYCFYMLPCILAIASIKNNFQIIQYVFKGIFLWLCCLFVKCIAMLTLWQNMLMCLTVYFGINLLERGHLLKCTLSKVICCTVQIYLH